MTVKQSTLEQERLQTKQDLFESAVTFTVNAMIFEDAKLMSTYSTKIMHLEVLLLSVGELRTPSAPRLKKAIRKYLKHCKEKIGELEKDAVAMQQVQSLLVSTLPQRSEG